jgi:hypothetical protein
VSTGAPINAAFPSSVEVVLVRPRCIAKQGRGLEFGSAKASGTSALSRKCCTSTAASHHAAGCKRRQEDCEIADADDAVRAACRDQTIEGVADDGTLALCANAIAPKPATRAETPGRAGQVNGPSRPSRWRTLAQINNRRSFVVGACSQSTGVAVAANGLYPPSARRTRRRSSASQGPSDREPRI